MLSTAPIPTLVIQAITAANAVAKSAPSKLTIRVKTIKLIRNDSKYTNTEIETFSDKFVVPILMGITRFGSTAESSDLRKRGVVLREGQTPRDMYEERCKLYTTYADFTIAEEQLNMEETLQKILDCIS